MTTKVSSNAFSPVRSTRSATSKWVGISLTMLLLVAASGCKKKVPVPPPPPPVAPAAVVTPPAPARANVAEFVAEPATIERGQSANLRWAVTGSNDVVIDNGIGTVPANGSRTVRPAESTTYTLTANGLGGTVTKTARIVVTAPPPPPPPPATAVDRRGTVESRIQSDLKDTLYDYDSNNIRDDARAALTANADALKRIFADFPSATIAVEGHCDERGSAEYNLGLGDRRSNSARDFLIQLGIPAEKLKPISYGKERPQCTEASEGCYQSNRRAHFASGQ